MPDWLYKCKFLICAAWPTELQLLKAVVMAKGRILFIDSESPTMRMFSADLSDAGYSVTFLQNFEEARFNIETVSDNPYDLIAVNIGRKEFTGCDFCKELRKLGIKSPIMIQSGYNDGRTLLDAMRAGASDYLVKPYTKEELLKRVQILLEMPQLVSRDVAALSMSNLPRIEDYCTILLERAIKHIDSIRPYAGALPAYKSLNKDEARPLPFDEETAKELTDALVAVQEILSAQRPDIEKLALLRVILLTHLQQLSAWLSARVTVVTDEMLKNLVKVGGVIFVAHAMGLKVDIMHLSAALGILISPTH